MNKSDGGGGVIDQYHMALQKVKELGEIATRGSVEKRTINMVLAHGFPKFNKMNAKTKRKAKEDIARMRKKGRVDTTCHSRQKKDKAAVHQAVKHMLSEENIQIKKKTERIEEKIHRDFTSSASNFARFIG